MPPLWTLADLIDLHYFTQLDEELRRREGDAALAKRDRILYLAKIEPLLSKTDEVPARVLVRKWLTMRRWQYRNEHGEEAVLPGALWAEMGVVCRWLVFGVGLLAGIGLAGSLLLYSGTAPLNVAVYLGLFVGLQLVLLGLQGILFGLRRWRRTTIESTAIYLALGRMLMGGLDGLRRRLHRALSGRQRLDLAAVAGSVRQRQELAALLIWPAFVLVQISAIGCNLGVIGVSLAKVAFFDIAFAWQSSLQLSADLVAGLVRWIALPWSWIGDAAYPSLAQIQGSQVVLKEGMTHLAAADLIAWWPFLVCAVLVYGLIPRCVLLAVGVAGQRRALDRLHFATLAFRPLLQRLTVPRVETNGRLPTAAAAGEQLAANGPHQVTTGPAVTQGHEVVGAGTFWVLIPDELLADCPQEDLRAAVASRFGGKSLCFGLGPPGGDQASFLARLDAAAMAGSLAGVLLLHEAWQPPLKETEGFVRWLRERIGSGIPLTVLLIGRPSSATILTPADPAAVTIWERKMRALGDPLLEVRPLVQP